jgi:hypothetical protein
MVPAGIESAADGSGAMWRDAEHPEIPSFNVWAIFPQDTKYFQPSRPSFMINFRVENLDELLKALREESVEVEPKVDDRGETSGVSTRGSERKHVAHARSGGIVKAARLIGRNRPMRILRRPGAKHFRPFYDYETVATGNRLSQSVEGP